MIFCSCFFHICDLFICMEEGAYVDNVRTRRSQCYRFPLKENWITGKARGRGGGGRFIWVCLLSSVCAARLICVLRSVCLFLLDAF